MAVLAALYDCVVASGSSVQGRCNKSSLDQLWTIYWTQILELNIWRGQGCLAVGCLPTVDKGRGSPKL